MFLISFLVSNQILYFVILRQIEHPQPQQSIKSTKHILVPILFIFYEIKMKRLTVNPILIHEIEIKSIIYVVRVWILLIYKYNNLHSTKADERITFALCPIPNSHMTPTFYSSQVTTIRRKFQSITHIIEAVQNFHA